MVKREILTESILNELNKVGSDLIALISAAEERKINSVPFENSWTAAQVIVHVTKSNLGMTESLRIKGSLPLREPDSGVETLKKIFLDFGTRLKSPQFILPEEVTYSKKEIVSNLQNSFWNLIATARQTNLLEEIKHPIFQNITKLEIVHFVVYHTKRHIHQLQNVFNALK